MGISIILEDERCERLDSLEDPKNMLYRVFPSADDHSYLLLRFIDWYGNAVFNHLQMDTLVEEIERVKSNTRDAETIAILDRVRDFARRCKEEPHVYLKFLGD